MAESTRVEAPLSGYRWVVMGAWMLSGVSGFMVLSTLGVLLPSVSRDLDLSPAQQGLLGSAAFWGNIALAIPLSWLTSRFRPKLLTTITLIVGTSFLFLQGFATTFMMLLLGRLAFGISIIARQPARAILTQQWFPSREVVMVNSLANVLFGIVVGGGLIVSPMILSALGDNWRGTLFTFGGLFILLTILWTVLGRERNPENISSGTMGERSGRDVTLDLGVLRGGLGYRDLWVGGFGFVGATLAWAAFLSFFPTLMLNTYGVPLGWSGGILALGIFMGGLSGLGMGYLAMTRNWGRGILLLGGFLMTGTYLGMTTTSSIPLLLVLSFINGIAWGFWPILFTVPFHLPGIRPRELSVAVAFTMMATSIGTALGPLLTGFLQTGLGDLRHALLIVSLAPLSLLVAGWLLRLRGQPEEVTTPNLSQPASQEAGSD